MISNYTKEEIEQLVEASQSGDADSFAKLYDIFVASIYRYIYFRVGNDEAEDLTELVFLKTWENIRQYARGAYSFSAWIFRIAHNVVVDFYRLNRLNNEEHPQTLPDMRLEAQTSRRASLRMEKEVLGEAMKELKDEYRQILILKFINDFTNEEIGHITGRSQASLRILQFRALKSLRRLLEERGISDVDA